MAKGILITATDFSNAPLDIARGLRQRIKGVVLRMLATVATNSIGLWVHLVLIEDGA